MRYNLGIDATGRLCHWLCEIVTQYLLPHIFGAGVFGSNRQGMTARLEYGGRSYSFHNSPHVDQDDFGSLCRHLKSKQLRLPRKKDLERKQQAILNSYNSPALTCITRLKELVECWH